MTDPEDLVGVALEDDERLLLRCGLLEWAGPARCTDAMAAAMEFTDAGQLLAETEPLRVAVENGAALSRWDWSRVLLATEIAFASDVMGRGWEWSITTGLSDTDTIQVLWDVQRKLVTVRVSISGWVAATQTAPADQPPGVSQ